MAGRATAQLPWRVGLYIRLSKDDGRRESLSVQNQRKILLDFLEHDFQGPWVLEGEYVEATIIIGLNQQSLETQGVAPV